MIYYIYHIPNHKWKKTKKIGKIGCTDDLEKRMIENGATEYEVLETHSDIYIASDREIELQKQYGYPVDNKPYWKIVELSSVAGKIRGEQIVKSGDWYKISQIGNNKENRKKASESLKKTVAEKGLHKGEKNFRAKLKESDVAKIRTMYESGQITNKAKLGRLFGVSDSMIRYIVQYKNWN
jgi:hypothetical protein